jgi:hypothetical protein
MSALRAALIMFVAACGSGPISAQHANMGDLTFDAPASWHRSDASRRGVSTTIWTPSDDNTDKESIVVTRTELVAHIAAAGQSTISRLLQRAAALPGARARDVQPYATSTGLQGARVELDYIPPGQSKRYHRVHVVLVERTALVHVIYTALNADDDERALGLVLSTIQHHEEG